MDQPDTTENTVDIAAEEVQANAPATSEKDAPESAESAAADVVAENAAADSTVPSGAADARKDGKNRRAPMSAKTKKRLHDWLFIPILIVIAAVLRAIAVRMFMTSPAFHFAPGGVTGIGTMIEYATDGKFSTGYTNIIINAPLLVIAFIFLSKPYAIKTAAAVGLASGLMILMQKVGFPQYGGPNDPTAEPVLAAAACGVIGGIGVAMMLRAGASNGGTDIVAAFIQRKFQATGITWFIMGLDGIVIFVSYFVYDNGLTPVFMSLTQQFCSAMLGDVILTGIKSAIKYEIITDDPENLSAELISKLHHSVTKLDATGMYSHSERALLVCVIHKRQLADFNAILKKYPNTFAYVSTTTEVFGKFV